MSDPYWDNVVLLIQPPSTAADGSTSILDESNYQRAVSRHGAAQVDTSLGSPVVQFDGDGDYLTIGYAAELDLSSLYTVEMLFTVSDLSKARQWLVQKGPYFAVSITAAGDLEVRHRPNGSLTTATFSAVIAVNTLYHLEISVNVPGSYTRIFLNGVQKNAKYTLSVSNSSSPLFVGRYDDAGYYPAQDFAGTLRVRFTMGVARHTTADSFSWPTSFEVPPRPVAVRVVLDQPWSIKTGAHLDQPWGDSPVTRALLYQPWSDAASIRSILKQPWQDALAARALLAQPWAILSDARAVLNQPWAITAEGVRALLDQPWLMADYNPVRGCLDQPWSIAADDTVLRYTVTVTVGGKTVRPSSVTIEGDLAEDSLSCELQLESEADYLRCRDGMDILVAIVSSAGSEQFEFVVTVLRITEEFGNAQYIVEGLSRSVLMGPPYSLGYSGPLEGLASSIATTLVPGVHWQTVDWEIPPGLWTAAGETRLELLKLLAAAVGAVVQADPDGSVRVQPECRHAVNRWGAVPADGVLVETLDCFTVGSTFDPRSGFNRYLVGDQATSGAQVTLELSDVSPGVMEARVYEVPWTGELTLTHTGGYWAVTVPMGVEEREETDTVEFVGGAGQTRFPVYKVSAVTWLHTDLGTLTAAEGGAVAATVAGQSLARITYTTRCRLWKLLDTLPEKLQVVVEQ